MFSYFVFLLWAVCVQQCVHNQLLGPVYKVKVGQIFVLPSKSDVPARIMPKWMILKDNAYWGIPISPFDSGRYQLSISVPPAMLIVSHEEPQTELNRAFLSVCANVSSTPSVAVVLLGSVNASLWSASQRVELYHWLDKRVHRIPGSHIHFSSSRALQSSLQIRSSSIKDLSHSIQMETLMVSWVLECSIPETRLEDLKAGLFDLVSDLQLKYDHCETLIGDLVRDSVRQRRRRSVDEPPSESVKRTTSPAIMPKCINLICDGTENFLRTHASEKVDLDVGNPFISVDLNDWASKIVPQNWPSINVSLSQADNLTLSVEIVSANCSNDLPELTRSLNDSLQQQYNVSIHNVADSVSECSVDADTTGSVRPSSARSTPIHNTLSTESTALSHSTNASLDSTVPTVPQQNENSAESPVSKESTMTPAPFPDPGLNTTSSQNSFSSTFNQTGITTPPIANRDSLAPNNESSDTMVVTSPTPTQPMSQFKVYAESEAIFHFTGTPGMLFVRNISLEFAISANNILGVQVCAMSNCPGTNLPNSVGIRKNHDVHELFGFISMSISSQWKNYSFVIVVTSMSQEERKFPAHLSTNEVRPVEFTHSFQANISSYYDNQEIHATKLWDFFDGIFRWFFKSLCRFGTCNNEILINDYQNDGKLVRLAWSWSPLHRYESSTTASCVNEQLRRVISQLAPSDRARTTTPVLNSLPFDIAVSHVDATLLRKSVNVTEGVPFALHLSALNLSSNVASVKEMTLHKIVNQSLSSNYWLFSGSSSLPLGIYGVPPINLHERQCEVIKLSVVNRSTQPETSEHFLEITTRTQAEIHINPLFVVSMTLEGDNVFAAWNNVSTQWLTAQTLEKCASNSECEKSLCGLDIVLLPNSLHNNSTNQLTIEWTMRSLLAISSKRRRRDVILNCSKEQQLLAIANTLHKDDQLLQSLNLAFKEKGIGLSAINVSVAGRGPCKALKLTPVSSNSTASDHAAIIIGVAVLLLVLISALLIVIFLFINRRHRRPKTRRSPSEDLSDVVGKQSHPLILDREGPPLNVVDSSNETSPLSGNEMMASGAKASSTFKDGENVNLKTFFSANPRV